MTSIANTYNTLNKLNKEAAEVTISANETIDSNLLDTFYTEERTQAALVATLSYINERIESGLTLPYFMDVDAQIWHSKPKALDIYITDESEGRSINLDARGKDYATNILSYPSEIPASVIELMPTLPLGELIICHEVVVREASEQNKTIEKHLTHLLVHGVLHLFGFDHELGQAEQDEMEAMEIAILAHLTLPNPYL